MRRVDASVAPAAPTRSDADTLPTNDGALLTAHQERQQREDAIVTAETSIPSPTRESWLTPAQVAAIWNVSVRFVQEECQRGNLKAKRLGTGARRQYRITPSQMRMYEARASVGGDAR